MRFFYFLHSLLKIDSKIGQVLCDFVFTIFVVCYFFASETMDFKVCERLQQDIFGKNLCGKLATAVRKLSLTMFKGLLRNRLHFWKKIKF